MRAGVIGLSAALLAVARGEGAELRYRAVILESRSGPSTVAAPTAISANGEVVGYSYANGYPALACTWSDAGAITILGDLPGGSQYSEAHGINSSGFVTGHGALPEGVGQAFLYSPGDGFQALGSIGITSHESRGFDINAANHVVGWSSSPQGQQAILWTPEGGMLGLGALPANQFTSHAWAINNLDQVVGRSFSYLVPSGEAFIWDAENGMRALGLLPNNSGFADCAYDINDLGQVTGFAQLAGGGGEGFLWDSHAGYTLFGSPWKEYPYSTGFSINDHAVIVGAVASSETWPRYRAIIWDRVNGVRDLNDLLDPCGVPELDHVFYALAINNSGQIVCSGIPNEGLRMALRLDPYLVGDLDEDGSVALQDLATLLGNFERAGDATYEHGDLDCDQDVDLQDLAILLSNFGESLPD